MSKYLRLWQRRLEWLFSSPHSRKREGRQVVLSLSRELAEYFKDVNLTATDIAVGLILLKREQKIAREDWEIRESIPHLLSSDISTPTTHPIPPMNPQTTTRNNLITDTEKISSNIHQNSLLPPHPIQSNLISNSPKQSSNHISNSPQQSSNLDSSQKLPNIESIQQPTPDTNQQMSNIDTHSNPPAIPIITGPDLISPSNPSTYRVDQTTSTTDLAVVSSPILESLSVLAGNLQQSSTSTNIDLQSQSKTNLQQSSIPENLRPESQSNLDLQPKFQTNIDHHPFSPETDSIKEQPSETDSKQYQLSPQSDSIKEQPPIQQQTTLTIPQSDPNSTSLHQDFISVTSNTNTLVSNKTSVFSMLIPTKMVCDDTNGVNGRDAGGDLIPLVEMRKGGDVHVVGDNVGPSNTPETSTPLNGPNTSTIVSSGITTTLLAPPHQQSIDKLPNTSHTIEPISMSRTASVPNDIRSPSPSRIPDRRVSQHNLLDRHNGRDRWVTPERRPTVMVSGITGEKGTKDIGKREPRRVSMFDSLNLGIESRRQLGTPTHVMSSPIISTLNNGNNRHSMVSDTTSRRMSYSFDFRTPTYFDQYTTLDTMRRPHITRDDILDVLHFSHYAEMVYINFDAIHYGKLDLLLHVSPKNDLFMSPYLVTVDHDWSCIVISIRGTFSVADVLVDLAIDLEPLVNPDECDGGQVLFVHSGMVRAARNIYESLIRDIDLVSLIRDRESKWYGYGVVVCGHSLGAGIAALVTYFLRQSGIDGARCYAYEPPGSLACKDAVPVFEEFCVSVVMGDDLVPRLNRHTLDILKRDLKRLIGECDVPKYRIIGSVLWNMCKGKSEKTRVLVERVKERGKRISKIRGMPIEVLKRIRRQTLSLTKKWRRGEIVDTGNGNGDMKKEDDMDMSCPPMYMPGRILYLEKLRGFSYGDDDAVLNGNNGQSGQVGTQVGQSGQSGAQRGQSGDNGLSEVIVTDPVSPTTSQLPTQSPIRSPPNPTRSPPNPTRTVSPYRIRRRQSHRRKGNTSLTHLKLFFRDHLTKMQSTSTRRVKDYRYVYVPRWAKCDEFGSIVVSRSMMRDHSPFGVLREFENGNGGVPLRTTS